MGTYNHGIRVSENATVVPSPAVSTLGPNVFVGIAPVNLADSPAVNEPIVCNTWAEFVESFGYSDDWATYGLCAAAYFAFRVYGIGPIVCINVLDPDTHKTALSSTTVELSNGVATVETVGILKTGLTVVSEESTLVAGTDYELGYDDSGYLTITSLADVAPESYTVTGYKINPGAVTTSEVIGGVDSSTGAKSGIECIRDIHPTYGLYPGMIAAPGFSQEAAVAAALVLKTTELNGVYLCEAAIDLDSTNTTVYSAVEAAKDALGIVSEHAILLWPSVKVGSKVAPFSAAYPAMAAYTDYANGNVPSLSPSNQLLNIDAVCTSAGVEIYLDQPEANELNAIGVVTALNRAGIRAWGNNTAAYPDVTDPKDRWIPCRRFFSWWTNSFIDSYVEEVDQPTSYRQIMNFVDKENIKINSYAGAGLMAGGRLTFDIDENPIENILAGTIIFHEYLAPYTPAEDIHNVLEFDPTILYESLNGGE